MTTSSSQPDIEVVRPTDVVDDQQNAERRLKRKLDVVILPLTTLLYLFAYLDRGNAGNARLQELQKDLMDDSDAKFSIALTCFYVAYIAFNVPGNIMAKILQPSTALAIAALIWGVASTLQAAAFNFAGFLVCRLFLGIGEACFGPTVPFYYSVWYKRDEIAVRNALFIGCGAVAGAFGGLLAYGVSFAKETKIGATWRILFLIEGLPTIVLALVIYYVLPSRPESSEYLSDAERKLIRTRLYGQQAARLPTQKFHWSGARRAIGNYKNYLYGIIYLGVNLTLSSVSGFLPTIIASLGYANASAQLHTVPLYACAAVFMVILSRLSDRLRSYGLFVASTMLLSCVGWIILLTVVSNQHVRSFATYLVVMGAFAAVPLMLSWVSNSAPDESERVVALGMLNGIGQCFAILANFIFPSADEPLWRKGFTLNLTFNALSVVVALALYFILRRENARCDRQEDLKNSDTIRMCTITSTGVTPRFRYVP